MDDVCSKCGAVINLEMRFCSNCGCKVSTTQRTSRLFKGIKTQFKVLGDKATTVGRTAGGLSQEKATESMKSVLNLLVEVAKNIKRDIPPEMIKAIDLNAEVSFIAFSMCGSATLSRPIQSQVTPRFALIMCSQKRNACFSVHMRFSSANVIWVTRYVFFSTLISSMTFSQLLNLNPLYIL